MSEMKTYRFERISDLLAVPRESRRRMLDEIGDALNVAEVLLVQLRANAKALGLPDPDASAALNALTWRDDDRRYINVTVTAPKEGR